MAPAPIATTPAEIRSRFARGRFIERAIGEAYTCCVKYRRPRILRTEPLGVESITLRFLDDQDRLVFVVHCYLRPNGELGGSGLFDPKYLRDDDGSGYFVP